MISAIQKYTYISSTAKMSVGVGIGGVLTYGLGATNPLALAAIFGFGQIISRLPDGIYRCLSKKKIEVMNAPKSTEALAQGIDNKEPSDDLKESSLHLALTNQNTEKNYETSVPIMDAILSSRGPKGLAKQNHEGNTALHVAIINDDYRSAWHLIQRMRQEDLAKQNNSGNTALHEVIKLNPDHATNYTNVFLELLTKMNKNHLSIKNNKKESALDLLKSLLKPNLSGYCWRLLQQKDLEWALQGVRPIIISRRN